MVQVVRQVCQVQQRLRLFKRRLFPLVVMLPFVKAQQHQQSLSPILVQLLFLWIIRLERIQTQSTFLHREQTPSLHQLQLLERMFTH